MSEPAIAARRVSKFFGDFPAIRSVDLSASAGEVLALLGRNGAGKTTLLRMLAGLTRPSSGEIRVAGAADPQEVARRIGVLGHGVWLYEDLTAAENLRFFGALYQVAELEARISFWLEQTGLARFEKARLSEFSRGMRQRLAVARAFLHDPDVLLLDEPWTALDDRAVRFLSDQIADARRRGRTVVVCSHQLREALETADRIAVLDRGRLVFTGPNSPELQAAPERLYERIS